VEGTLGFSPLRRAVGHFSTYPAERIAWRGPMRPRAIGISRYSHCLLRRAAQGSRSRGSVVIYSASVSPLLGPNAGILAISTTSALYGAALAGPNPQVMPRQFVPITDWLFFAALI